MYNPYDLMQITIDGQPTQGRPFQFDSYVHDQMTMKNIEGNLVKPIKLSTICPKCGSGMIINLPVLPDPPFDILNFSCIECNPPVEPMPDPFMNPVNAGRMGKSELDHLLAEDIEIGDGLVSDKIDLDSILSSGEEAPKASGEKIDQNKHETPKVQDEPKEKPENKPKSKPKPKPKTKPKPEVKEFDDSDLVDDDE